MYLLTGVVSDTASRLDWERVIREASRDSNPKLPFVERYGFGLVKNKSAPHAIAVFNLM